MARLAFLGTGSMGVRMARRLQAGDDTLTVWNRSAEKAKPLVDAGAKPVRTPAEAAVGADILFTMLRDPQAVRDVAHGPDGFLNRMRPRALWIDFSSVDPAFARTMAEDSSRRDIRHLDAPVSGSVVPAEKGELTVLVGGAAADLEAARPYLEKVGRRIVHAGDHGQGAALKLTVNMVLAQAMLAFSEALGFGESQGLSRELLLDTLLAGPLAAPFLAHKREKLTRGEYPAEFALALMRKDLHLAMDSAWAAGFALPSAALTEQLYAQAQRQGLGELDFSAIDALFRKHPHVSERVDRE